MDELKIIKAYESGKSIHEIAEEFSTYSVKIYRILKKHNVELRDKKESQSLALSKGRAKHPTKGKPVATKTKEKISDARAKAWKSMTKENKESFAEQARVRWEKMPAADKEEMQRKASEGLREASLEGSEIEKYIRSMLVSAGYNVTIQRSNIGGDYEVDIYLKDQQIAIEIDGPLHFLPLFGEEKLQKTIKQDAIKNGLLLSKGIHVVRIRYSAKSPSLKAKRDLWKKLEAVLKEIQKGKLSGLIEV